MRLRVVAEAADVFEAWRRAQAVVPAAPASTAAGARLFQRLTCTNCHTIAGTPATGTAGPNLTHIGSRATLAAGVLSNTPDGLTRWLRDPQAVKPGSLMPNFHLRDDEVTLLVAYLEALR
jgi:cytochrome c oxidase subunit 2